MSSVAMTLPMAVEEEKDPLAIDEEVQIKHEGDDNFEGNLRNFNENVIKKEVSDIDFNNLLSHVIPLEPQRVKNVHNFVTNKEKVVKILPFTKKVQARKKDAGSSSEIVEIKKGPPCNCMQNIEYYCNKCDKTLRNIDEMKQCSECNNQLKLQCRLCHKRYKLLKSMHRPSIFTDMKQAIDIKEERHDHIMKSNHQPTMSYVNGCSSVLTPKKELLYCYKCEFSTKDKEILNVHILKSHWEPKDDFKFNDSDDDMYIELLCKKCQKLCRKVAYNDLVKLVCRECQIPMLYRCTLCRTGYKLLKNVRYHVKLVCPYRTNNEKFYCADCTFKTETKLKLENHIIKKHLNQQCSNCNTLFEDNDALREHVLEHCTVKKEDILPIKLELPTKEPTDEDEKFIIFQYDAQDLVKGISGKLPKDTKEWRTLVDYLCLECGGEVNKKFARYRPWCKKCNLKYDYRCISCERLYGNYDRIVYHVKFGCPNRIIFECPLCKFHASKKGLLVTHIQTKHTIYKCMECFTNVQGLPAMKKHQTVDCYKGQPHTLEQLEKLVTLYCKQCFRRPKKVGNAVKEMCDRCHITLSYQCLRCFNLFNRQDLAYKHMKELCHPKFTCLFDKCTFKTYTHEKLNTHTKYKHSNRMCVDCGVCFKDELIFQLHRREEIRRKTMKHLTDIGLLPYPKKFKPS